MDDNKIFSVIDDKDVVFVENPNNHQIIVEHNGNSRQNSVEAKPAHHEHFSNHLRKNDFGGIRQKRNDNLPDDVINISKPEEDNSMLHTVKDKFNYVGDSINQGAHKLYEKVFHHGD